MRILVWEIKDPVGGVENVVMNYVRRFDHEKVIVDCLVKGRSFAYASELADYGGQVFYMPPHLPRANAYRKRLREIFENGRYDAVWCNFSGLTNLDVLICAKEYGVPVRAAHSHAASLTWGGRLARFIVPVLHHLNKLRIHKYATDYLACSRDAGAFMFPAKCQKSVKLMKNAIEVERFRFDGSKREAVRREYNCTDLVVGHVARMCREKNQLFLLDVMAAIVRLRPGAKLLFLGDGELREDITAHCRELGLDENVLFLGNRSDVYNYLSAMDVFLLPSLTEGLPLSVIEAQSCGIPCVMSDAVPREADVTGAVRFVPLKAGPAAWAEAAIAQSEVKIPEPAAAVGAAGYDINEAVQSLMKLLQHEE